MHFSLLFHRLHNSIQKKQEERMTSIVELFPKSRKLAYDTKQQLSQVQNGLLCPSELFISLDELNRQLDLLENLLNKELPAQREIWNRKIE